jgi:hypothetical protein
LDLQVLQEGLAGTVDHQDEMMRCSVDNDDDCDILDLVILKRAIDPLLSSPPLNALCPRNVPSGTVGTDH